MANPDLIRRLDVGQSAYIYRGGVTYIQVKAPDADDSAAGAAALPGPPDRSAQPASPGSSPANDADAVQPEAPRAGPPAGGLRGEPPGPQVDVAALLDEAFGPSPRGPR